MNSPAKNVSLAYPLQSFIAYLSSKATYSWLLFAWAFLATILNNSVFTTIEQTYRNFPDFITQTTYAYILFFAITFLFGIVNILFYKNFTVYIDRYIVFIFLYASIAIFSLARNRGYMATDGPLHLLWKLLVPLVLCVLIVQTLKRRHIETIGKIFIAFALINIAISFVEIYINRDNNLTISHISGVFTDRNLLARFVSIAQAYVLADYLSLPKRKLFGKHLFLSLLFFACVSLLFSRSGYVMYLFSVVYVVAQTEHKAIKRATVVIMGIVLIVFAAMLVVRVKVERMDIWPSSDVGRLGTLKTGFNMIKESPLYGIGYGMGIERYAEFQDKHFPGLRDITTIHNIFVNCFAEQGVIGLIAYLLMNFGLLFALRRRFKGRPMAESKFEVFCFAALAIHMLHGMVYHSIDYEGVYWIIIALSIIALRERNLALEAQE